MHGKSLIEANSLFLEKYRSNDLGLVHILFTILFVIFLFCPLVDSLRHRAAVAEMVFVLEPSKKKEATSLIEESSNDLGSPYATR